MIRWRVAAVAAVASLTLGMSACGGDDTKASADPTPTASTTPSNSSSSEPTSPSASASATESGTPSSAADSAPTPSATGTATPQFIKAVAKGLFKDAKANGTMDMTRKQSRCVATEMVSAFGTDRLVEWGLNQAATPKALDQIKLTEAEAGASADAFRTCGVLTREKLIEQIKASGGADATTPAMAKCLESTIDDTLFRALMVDQFLGLGADAPSAKAMQASLTDCLS